MPSVFINVCFCEILRSICYQFSLGSPTYGVPEKDEDDLFIVCIDMEYVGPDTCVKKLKCWGGPSATPEQAEDSAARRTIEELRDDFKFEVDDFHFYDKSYFENLYTSLSEDYSELQIKCNQLKREYNILRGFYDELLQEKKRFTDKLKKDIESTQLLLNKLNDETSHQSHIYINSGAGPSAS